MIELESIFLPNLNAKVKYYVCGVISTFENNIFKKKYSNAYPPGCVPLHDFSF